MASLALEMVADKLHHVRDFLLRQFVFEGGHLFFAVRDHLGELIVSVFDCMFRLQRRNFDLFLLDLHKSSLSSRTMARLAVLREVGLGRCEWVN